LAACASFGAVSFCTSSALAQDIDEERPPGMGEDDGDSGYAFGEEPATPEEPMRVLGMLGGGVSVRFINDVDYAQQRFGPAYLDGWGGVLLPGSGTWRHAFGVNLSLNMSGDGDQMYGVNLGEQFVVGPSYLAYLRFDDFLIFPKVTIPIVVTGGPSVGLEGSLGAAYYLFAGFGIYAELAASVWWGQQNRFHPLATGEVGVLIDYEVLQ
jgi:hypothetical protein